MLSSQREPTPLPGRGLLPRLRLRNAASASSRDELDSARFGVRAAISSEVGTGRNRRPMASYLVVVSLSHTRRMRMRRWIAVLGSAVAFGAVGTSVAAAGGGNPA